MKLGRLLFRDGGGVFYSRPFLSYLVANSTTQLAFSMQQLFINWILIGMLDTSAARVGMVHALVGIPGLFLMLLGGVSADRTDSRLLLMRTYTLGAFVPLLLILARHADLLNVWTVTLWAMLMSLLMSYTTPAQTAILNRASGRRLQEAVTAAMSVGFVMQMLGLALAGQMEVVGLDTLLLLQSVCIAVGALLTRQLEPLRVPGPEQAPPAWKSVLAGLEATRRHPLILNLLSLNFLSMMFNAGSFFLVLPFIITRIYGGDAAFLGWMLVITYLGSSLSSFMLLRFMPMRHPGRLFLLMQGTRIIIFLLYWVQPPLWLLVTATFLWGMNLGVTTTISRSLVQESAPADFRARILSVFGVCLLGAPPLGALLLGWCVNAFGILNSMLPGVFVSLFILFYGCRFSGLWQYVSLQQGGKSETV